MHYAENSIYDFMQFSVEVWPNSNEISRLATKDANPYIGVPTKGGCFGKERASVVAVVKLGDGIAQLGAESELCQISFQHGKHIIIVSCVRNMRALSGEQLFKWRKRAAR